MRCKAKALHLLTTVALIVSLLLPGAEIFVPTVALAQSDPTPVGEGEIPEVVPTPFPDADWPEAPAALHPQYSSSSVPIPEPAVTLFDPIQNEALVNAAAMDQPAVPFIDTEAGKTGVVSGMAMATLADATQAQLGDLQLRIAYPTAAATQALTVDAEVLPAEQANEFSPVGMAFTLRVTSADNANASTTNRALELTLDYSQIPMRIGGSFVDRLALYRLTPCANGIPALAPGEPVPVFTEPCWISEPLPGKNDLVNHQLTVVITPTLATAANAAQLPEATGLANSIFLPLVRSTGGNSGVSDIDELYVLAAAASSQQGTYKATPLANVGDYQVSLATGAAQTSYPVPLPPAAGGLLPEVNLSYDSGSVDGMNVNKNNQPSWVGIGWSLEPGYIARRLKTCAISNAPEDLCLTGDNYVLVFNGVASTLVKDAGGLYHPQNDPRWKVQKFTNGHASHPDWNKEYWLVTTPDGTQYRFGGEVDPDKANADQNSAFYVPVYGSDCSSSNLGGALYWLCNKVWRWNLDRVVDPDSNVISYYYDQEINYYNARTFIRLPYTRAGNVKRIEYGRRTGSTTTPTQVIFNVEDRCESPCGSSNYPDVPDDISCAATGACDDISPTFWSKKRLNTIVTQYYNPSTSAWVNVATFDLDYSFPTPPNDADGDASERKLWLNSITQKDAGATNALPAVSYSYTMLKNRRDAEGVGGAGISALIMPRLGRITLPLGGGVRFNYGQSHPCPNSQSGFVQYSYDCYPAWNPIGTPAGFTLWHKWKVMTQVMSDTFSLNDTQVLTFTYSTPINHYDDDPVTPSAQKTWSDFRGSQIVTVIDGSGAKTEYRFHRGMHGDNDGIGGTINVPITDSNNESHGNDENWLRGRVYEVRRLTAANAARSRTATWYTTSLTAGTGRTAAYFVGTQKVDTVAYGTVNKTTREEYTYDSYGNVTRQILYGDTAITTDDRNVERSFVANTSAYIVDKPQWERLWSGTGTGIAGAERTLTHFFYDGAATLGTAPTRGNVTRLRQFSAVSPDDYSDTVTIYDTAGRPTSVTDARNNTSRTAYDSFYGYTSVMTNTLNHVSRYVNDPGWGVQTKVTDPNGKITEIQYDSFGRLQKVWLPTENKATDPASLEFVYTVATTPANVKTRTLRVKGSSIYLESWAYVDGFGRDLQTQTPMADGSRTVVAKRYNKLGQVVYSSAPFGRSGAAGSNFIQLDNSGWASLANYHYLQYEELGNLWLDETKSTNSVLWSTTTIHDAWQKRVYDPRGNRTDYDQNGFGQLVKVTEYNVSSAIYTTNYSYDFLGNLTGVTDHLNNVTTMTYDLFGRKKTMSDPDMGAWSYVYDKVGNLIEQTDARGLKIAMTYDALNRLTGKYQTNTAGPILALYEYDTLLLGQLAATKAYNGSGAVQVETRTVTQDNRYRPTQQRWTVAGTGGGTFRMDYAYNEADQRTSLTYPGDNAGAQGEVVSYTYNSVGQLTGASGSGVSYISSATYNAQGQLTQMVNDTSTNGLTRVWSYQANSLRLSTLQAGKNATAYDDRQKLTYGYDNNGNVTSLIDDRNQSQKQCFQYDYLNRLTAAFTGNSACTAFSAIGTGAYNLSYGYDAIGNMTTKDSTPVTYADAAHKHAASSAFGTNYTYDANGNQTKRDTSGTIYNLAYDYENRLTGISGASTATFVYDAGGNRVKSTVSLTTTATTTVYIAGIYEYQGGATTKYYEGNAMRRTGYSTNNGVFYLLQDHLKSSSVFVDQSGTTLATNYYLPYGARRGATLSTLSAKRFTGQYHEANLTSDEGLSYYGARWYDAKLGRFLSADTIVPRPTNPQAFNRYSYVINNPLKYVDPTGHSMASFDPGPGGGGRRPPYQPALNTRQINYVKEFSKIYGVPWQVVAGVVEAEVTLDTEWFDPVITAGLWATRGQASMLWACTWCLEKAGIHTKDPGPGIGNIHLSTARKVSSYFAQEYPNHPLPMYYHQLSDADTSFLLTFEAVNIQTITATVRMLADYRFGSNRQLSKTDHSDLHNWTIVDAVAMWHAYRYGVPDVSPGGQGFKGLEAFQDRSTGLYSADLFIGPGNPQESAYGSIPSFLYYFNQK